MQYGDPPDVEGPNFAELIPTPAQAAALPARAARPPRAAPALPIRNDGSFLEMFKKMQEQTAGAAAAAGASAGGAGGAGPERRRVMPLIGKRRGGRVLKTGLVKKARAAEDTAAAPRDAWALYMQEVKKYRDTSCEEDRKTRPLVK